MLLATSSLPVLRLHAAKSATAPASVARTSSSSPRVTLLMACAVLTIGIGHFIPLASSTMVVSMAFLSRYPNDCARSDEDDLAVACIDVERRDAGDAVDERIEVVRFEAEQIHRQRARLDVDVADLFGVAQCLRPRLLTGGTHALDGSLSQCSG